MGATRSSGRIERGPRVVFGALLLGLVLLAAAERVEGSGPLPPTAAACGLLLVAAIYLMRAVLRTTGRLSERALRDPLTGLANRSSFSDELALALDRRRPQAQVAVVYLDLDGFKAVNDHRGHHVGDELLVLVGARISQCLREQDVAARVGGDEFAVLLEDLPDGSRADAVADRVLESLARPFSIDGSEVRVRASIGVALCADGSDTADSLMDRADTAMYASKSQGRNRVSRFAPDMLESRRGRLELEFALHDAVSADRFRPHYQPVVDLHSGVVVGFEALARWTDPRLGVVDPEAFIAAAEATGLIRVLGLQLLERAHAGGRQLSRAAGCPLSIAVNMSAEQVTDPELAERVSELRRLDPDVHLVLELTESVLLEHAESTVDALEGLRARGVSLAIDDFGMGFSSLSYLDRLPMDSLKIDRSFVAKLPNPRSTSLVGGIVAMAHSMGLSVVCEGVEKREQLTTLRELGCTTGQGYLFGPALDLPAALELVARGPIALPAPRPGSRVRAGASRPVVAGV